jgi:hypothetical protein
MAEEVEGTAVIEAEGITAEEAGQILREFEARVESGALAPGTFHNAVQAELFRLIASGALSENDFSRLVERWAEKNHPWDWHVRSYLDEA